MGAGESFSMVIAEKFPSGSRVFFFFLYLFFVLNLQHRLFGCLENEKKKKKKSSLIMGRVRLGVTFEISNFIMGGI